jgi:hypothetical protein
MLPEHREGLGAREAQLAFSEVDATQAKQQRRRDDDVFNNQLRALSTLTTALLVAAFLAVNAIFFHALQGPTTAGRKMIAQLTEYRTFLAEVHADEISRMNSCDTPPPEMTQKQAYAIAFHLDLGWGQQFVETITDLVERSEVFSKVLRPQTQDS